MNIQPIRNGNDHEQALARLTVLLERDPAPESDASAELEVLTTLIEQYEAKHFPIAPPTPVEAIRFRMDQLGLRNKDLVPYIGSPSKVSEVLNGKRSLSLAMIRKLHRHLDIPAEVLIQNQTELTENSACLDPSEFPISTMHRRGYFKNAPERWADAKKNTASFVSQLMADAGIREAGPAYCRSTAHYRDGKNLDTAALLAWQARVLVRARERAVPDYSNGAVDELFMDRVAALSVFNDEGPRLAREFLEKHGIAVVIEKHLPKTYLDGAAFLSEDGSRVIGLTLRHDKLDNFWFTLLHELAHVGWHLSPERSAIFDDVTVAANDKIEREADARATEILIPAKQWRFAAVRESHAAVDALALAQTVQRHPAVIVGRLQRETGSYGLLATSIGVGRGQVRREFEEFQD